ncbi:MAG: hypothetical protein ACYDDO_00005 [Acidiferrobacterales bacterium]
MTAMEATAGVARKKCTKTFDYNPACHRCLVQGSVESVQFESCSHHPDRVFHRTMRSNTVVSSGFCQVEVAEWVMGGQFGMKLAHFFKKI